MRVTMILLPAVETALSAYPKRAGLVLEDRYHFVAGKTFRIDGVVLISGEGSVGSIQAIETATRRATRR